MLYVLVLLLHSVTLQGYYYIHFTDNSQIILLCPPDTEGHFLLERNYYVLFSLPPPQPAPAVSLKCLRPLSMVFLCTLHAFLQSLFIMGSISPLSHTGLKVVMEIMTEQCFLEQMNYQNYLEGIFFKYRLSNPTQNLLNQILQ